MKTQHDDAEAVIGSTGGDSLHHRPKPVMSDQNSDGEAVDLPSYAVPDQTDDTIDNEEAELIDFKTLTWWQGGIVLVAETVSLGILSLPSVLATVGLIPGIILILVMSVLATYSGLILADFRKRYPFVQNFGDAVELLGKPLGMGAIFREMFGWAQTLLQVFLMGGHLLMWTICMNTLSNSSVCTVVWAVIGAVVFWFLNLPRTLKYASWMSMSSCISIVVAVLITMIDVALEKPIGSASIDLFRSIGFSPAFLAVTNISAAFSSHSIFFSVIGEFKNPDDWPKALALLQVTDTLLYLVSAIVIYVYVGPSVPSPALSAAGSATVRKAIWGVAIPTIAIAGVIYAHVAAQYIFTRIFRDSKHTVRRTKLSTVAWAGTLFVIWAIGLIIAESIPVFNSLLGIIAAAFASWFSYGLPGVFWLWMNHGDYFGDWRQCCRFVFASVLFVTGVCLCVLGLWASAEALAKDSGSKPWTCASNAT
ncbi:N amino acid transport system protein 7 [Pleurostoma richardsiae]|uniref:N amino acid transport system protein 7 n=1 Tax=Pleurostoma richardsiae TaxID=41990 RepID=A0AA38VUR1_9PEZI|nr:N amino acid transport system protein 7 [Pleurostoma richardsiae]